MSAITKLHRQLVKKMEATAERLKELDVAGTDDEVAALLEGLIGPGIGGNIDSINAILDTVTAYTGDEADADDDTDAEADDDFDDATDEDADDEFGEDAEDTDSEDEDADDDEFGDADDDDDDDFSDDGEDGDDDDFADGDDDDVTVDDDEEDEPAPRRKPAAKASAKPVAPVKPVKPAAKAQPAAKPAAKPAAGNGKPSKLMQKLSAMNTAELKAHLLEGNPKRAKLIEAAIAPVGGRAKAAALLAFAVKKQWIA